jgi:PAS domain S-box-containing protein
MFKRIRDQWGLAMLIIACLATVYLGVQARQKTILKLVEQGEISEAFNAMFSNSSHGFAIFRGDGRIVAWNGPMVAITGYTKLEMSEHGLERLMSPEDRAKHRAAMSSVLRREDLEKVSIIDCEMLAKDGRKVQVHVSVRLAQATNGNVYMIAILDKQSKIKDIQGAPFL